ncbi:glycosyltransferase [Blautia sp. CAG:237]|uniref:glycosyltransferase n=1 Tax=Blautia sp. CAG:237 TaxID=1262755 RepID=UPI000339DC5B|nr:glycosyltransferase [Blautia sp. CAG:237]CDB77645.1 glycosyl transferase group 2 family [Blautia sp. CAG:237]
MCTKISIIVPVYDSMSDMETILESIDKQSFKEREVILVNLGNSKRALDKTKQHSDITLKQHIEETDNFFEEIQGKFIIFWNSSLSYEEQFLETMMRAAAKYEKAGAIVCNRNQEVQFSVSEQSSQILELAGISLYDILLRKDTAIKMMWHHGLSEQAMAGLALAVAETVVLLDRKLIADRSEKQDAAIAESVNSLMENAFALREELKRRELFQDLERNFVNITLRNYFSMLERISDKEIFVRSCCKTELYELGIGGHTRQYFYAPEDFDKLLELLEKPSEELWERRALKKAEKQKQVLVDLKDWSPSGNAVENVKVTVIIPFYNVENYLRECLESVTTQTFQNLEILCVDNASTDRSLDIAEKFAQKDPRICILREEAPGASAARNRALEKASGKYIYFLDSDDILKQKTLEFCVAMAEQEELDMVLFSAEEFYENESLQRDQKQFSGYYNRYGDYSGCMTGKEFFAKAVSYGEYKPAVYLCLMRRDILEKKGIRFIEGIVCEDNIFTIQCLTEAKKVRYVNGNFYRRRLREKSVMTGSSGLRLAYSYYVVLKSLGHYIEEEKFDREYCDVLLRQMDRMRDNACRAIWQMDFCEIEQEISENLTAEWIDFYFYVYSIKNIKALNEKNYRKLKKISENEKVIKLKALYQRDKQDNKNKELRAEIKELKCEIEDFQKEMKKYQLLKAEHNTLKEQHETLKSRMSGVLTSWSYKLGRGITAIPRKIRCIIKK